MTKLSPLQVHKSTKRSLPELERLLNHYPIPASPFSYDYGTAGFRYDHKLLPPVLVRMGIFASLRSASLNGEHVGIMVTASHNPESDNGIKLSDSNGGMMSAMWEVKATSLANAPSVKDVLSSLSTELMQKPMVVHIGNDTRIHSRPLAQLAIRACLAMGATVIYHGYVTTPQLHWSVLRSNPQNMPGVVMSCGVGGLEREYLEGIAGAYISLIHTKQYDDSLLELPTSKKRLIPRKNRNIIVDCACGVGGLKVPILNSILRQCEEEGRTWWMDENKEGVAHLVSVNVPGDGPLNENCGAEFVQKNQQVPKIFTEQKKQNNEGVLNGEYSASLDGDADRIVFHYEDKNNDTPSLRLLDGDKIAVLIAIFLQEELTFLEKAVPEASTIRCGVVQTAYANGSSTFFLKNTVKTKVVITKTGVKYVHAAAHSHFDVGIYFEANGHGTILFGPNFYQLLALSEQHLVCTSKDDRSTIAWQRLRVLPRLVNQAVGDALSDLLLVDAILFLKGWTPQIWNSLYVDMPSRQYKVRVRDKSVIVTNENETKVRSPTSLQTALDAALRSLSSSLLTSNDVPPRAFVRPSGTENVVRIYAEARNQNDVAILASELVALVYKFCDGVGEIPDLEVKSNL